MEKLKLNPVLFMKTSLISGEIAAEAAQDTYYHSPYTIVNFSPTSPSTMGVKQVYDFHFIHPFNTPF